MISSRSIYTRGQVIALYRPDDVPDHSDPGDMQAVRDALDGAGIDLVATLEYSAGPVVIRLTALRSGDLWRDLRGNAIVLTPLPS
jgi:hypothetical protein